MTPSIPDWYLAADGFILASDIESLPRSMLEAMAYENPVLGSAVFGVPDIVQDGATGTSSKPGLLGKWLGLSIGSVHCPPTTGNRSVARRAI